MAEAATRIAGEQLDTAITQLTEKLPSDPDKAIHTARKAIKRERSLVRLIRGAMPREERRHENAALRDAAQILSGGAGRGRVGGDRGRALRAVHRSAPRTGVHGDPRRARSRRRRS